MMRILLLVGASFIAPALSAAEVDCSNDGRLLNTYFARYGYAPVRTIACEVTGVRLRLPAAANVGQTGLYSYFALAGDFEVSAAYELITLTPPQNGYGATCGIAADTADQTTVSLARGHVPGQGSVYVATVGRLVDNVVKYDSTYHATQAKTGLLMLRREQNEVVFLAADTPAGTPQELRRVEFPLGTVRPIRAYADPGGARSAIDARLSRICARAVEVAGGVPEYEPPAPTSMWWLLAGVAVVAAAAFGVRRWQRKGS